MEGAMAEMDMAAARAAVVTLAAKEEAARAAAGEATVVAELATVA